MTLKKALVAITVVAMLFGMVGSAFASTPSDVVGTKFEASVNRLMALGVITGNPDGTYKPESFLTRAEAATIIVRALGLDTAAQIAKGATQFSDVAADHWASGYINIAASRGVVNGVGNGQFSPESQLTYAQWVTMLVRALGYEPLVIGGYPGGYISKAVQLHMLDGITVAEGGSASIPRGDVAIMTDTAVTKVGIVQANEYTDTVKYTVTTDTLAVKVLGVTEKKGYVVSATVDTDASLAANQFAAFSLTTGSGAIFTIHDGAYNDVKPLLGKVVNFGTKTFTYGLTDKTEVVYINTLTAADKTITGTIATGGVVVGGVAPDTYLASLKVKVGSATTATTFSTANYFGAAKNYRTADPVVDLADGDNVVLTLDDNGHIVYINDKVYTNTNALVDDVIVANEDEGVEAEIDFNNASDYTGADFADNLVVIRDGNRVAFGDLKAGDVARFTLDGLVVTSVEATSTKASGTISEVVDNSGTLSIKMGDKSYTLLANATFKPTAGGTDTAVTDPSFATAAAGTAAEISLGFGGKVRFIQLSPVANTVVGYVLDGADNKAYIEDGEVVEHAWSKVLTTAGETKTLKFADATGAPAAGSIGTFSLDADGLAIGFTAVSGIPSTADVAAIDATAKTITIGSNVYYFGSSTSVFDKTGTKVAAGSIDTIAAGQNVTVTVSGLTVKAVVVNKSAATTGMLVNAYTSTTTTTVTYLDFLTKSGVVTVSYEGDLAVDLAAVGIVGDLMTYRVSGGEVAIADLAPTTLTETNGLVANMTSLKTFDVSAGLGTEYAITPGTFIIDARDLDDIKVGSSSLVVNGKHVNIVRTSTVTDPQAISILVVLD